jgi:type 1 glutamine amidotransferase
VPVPTLLYVTQVAPYRDGPAGVHGVLDQSAVAIAELAETAGLAFQRVTDVRELDPSSVASARVVSLFTIGETPWSVEQQRALLGSVREGRTGILGIHAATDSCHGWDEYGSLVGARFDGHPWTRSFTLDVLDPSHPAVSHLGSTWEWHDEVYQFRGLRPDAQVLLAARADELGTDRSVEHPFAWCFTEGAGRAFYTALGHFPNAWETPTYLRHLAGGLDWVTAGAE